MPPGRYSFLACCFLLGCFSREECTPELLGVTDGEARLFNIEAGAPGDAVSFNRAGWVVSRLNDPEKQALDVSYLVAGRAAAVVFAFTHSPRCDPKWFAAEVDGVKVTTSVRHNELKIDNCGVAGCEGQVTYRDASFTELRVEWAPDSPATQTIRLSTPGYGGEIPARVGRHRSHLEPLAALPKGCWDVRRVGPNAFQCDQVIFANGTAIAEFDKAALVIGWEGFVAVWKGSLLQILQYENGRLTELDSMDVIDAEPYSMEWHEQAGLLYLSSARKQTRAVSFDRGRLGPVLMDVGPSSALTIAGEYLMQTRAAPGGTGIEVCVADPRMNFANAACETFGFFFAGSDRGVWVRNGLSVGLIRPVNGRPELVATRRSIEKPGANGLIYTANADTRFTSSLRGRPAELATRASCAFYEYDGSAELTLDVYPENEIHFGHDRSDDLTPPANGDGREGLRWCSDEGQTRTFVYPSDRSD